MRQGHVSNCWGIMRGIVVCGTVLGLLAVIACGPGEEPTPTATATSAAKVATPTPTATAVPTPTPGPKRGGILSKFDATDTEGTMDINRTNSSRAVPIIAPIFSNLLRYDPLKPTELVPDLARSWQVSADGKGYVFKLRNDAKFHDGTPVTVEDVVFSLRRIVGEISKEQSNTRVGPDLNKVWGGVEITGENEITIRTKVVSATFLGKLGSVFVKIVPKHAIEATAKGVFQDNPVGSGPFKLTKRQVDVLIEYERYPGYVTSYKEGPLPYLDGMRIYIIKDASAQIAAFQADQVSVWPRFPALSANQAKALKSFLGDKVVVGTNPDASTIVSRLNSARPIFKDPRVIKAIWVAMDRKTLSEVIFEGDFTPVLLDPDVFPDAALPLSEVYSYPGIKEPDYVLAKKLLADAGYPNGIEVELVTRNVDWYADASQVLIAGYAKAGIRVNHVLLDSAAGGARTNAGLYDVQATQTTGFAAPDPLEVFFRGFITGGSGNNGKWSDPELDKLILQADQTFDPAQRNKQIRDLQRYIYSTMSHGTVTAGVQKALLAHWKYVKGYVPSVTLFEGGMHDVTWLDK